MLIGLAASVAFLGLSLNAGRRPVRSFLAVGPIVAAGTLAANAAAGVSAVTVALATIGVSVLLAYAATALWYRAYRRWNARLHDYQRSNPGSLHRLTPAGGHGASRGAGDAGRAPPL